MSARIERATGLGPTSGSQSNRERPRGTLNLDRWQEVVLAASEVFQEKGYPAATLQNIADRIGMLRGSLYYYINSKEDLLFEILRQGHELGLTFIIEPPEIEASNARVRLSHLIRTWMEGIDQRTLAVTMTEHDLQYLGDHRRSEIIDMRNKISGHVLAIVQTGMKEGTFPSTVDPRVAAKTIMVVLRSTNSWFNQQGASKWSDVTDWYVHLFVTALAEE